MTREANAAYVLPGEDAIVVHGLRDDQVRIVVMNMEHGGFRGGDDTPWQASMAVLRDWAPHVALLQEIRSPDGKIAGLRRHLRRTANLLGMEPVLGPPTPQSVTSNHPAILVSRDLEIVDEGPPLWDAGGGTWPAWCHALVQVPGAAVAAGAVQRAPPVAVRAGTARPGTKARQPDGAVRGRLDRRR